MKGTDYPVQKDPDTHIACSEIPFVPQQSPTTSQHFMFAPSLLTPKSTLYKVFSRHFLVTTPPYGKAGLGAGEAYFSNAENIFLEKNVSGNLIHKPKRSLPYLQIHVVRE